MGQAIFRLFAPNLITVCVDSCVDGDISGDLWQQYTPYPAKFNSAADLLFQMEDLYDNWNFPQRSTNCRSFRPGPVQEERTASFKRGKNMGLHNVQDKRGKQGTFIVQVQYRQNSTWQGQVVWAEENRREHFRSALELLKLIDSALGEAAEGQDAEEKIS